MSFPQGLPHPSSTLAMTTTRNQKSSLLDPPTHQFASFRWTVRAINTIPPLAHTPRVLGVEDSITGLKKCKRGLLVRAMFVLSKAYFLLQRRQATILSLVSLRVHAYAY